VHYVFWQKGILSAWHYISPSNKKNNENTIADTESADVLVHLVHGTFEPNAPWTQSNSDLCKEINKINPGVGISRFVWDGKTLKHLEKMQHCSWVITSRIRQLNITTLLLIAMALLL
jgi:hypothetical protein